MKNFKEELKNAGSLIINWDYVNQRVKEVHCVLGNTEIVKVLEKHNYNFTKEYHAVGKDTYVINY